MPLCPVLWQLLSSHMAAVLSSPVTAVLSSSTAAVLSSPLVAVLSSTVAAVLSSRVGALLSSPVLSNAVDAVLSSPVAVACTVALFFPSCGGYCPARCSVLCDMYLVCLFPSWDILKYTVRNLE